MVEMSIEQRLHARDVHNEFFERCQLAIDHGFYLEAILLEYSAMEARMKVIMSILGKPCSLCGETEITNRVGLSTKIKCLKVFVNNNPKFYKDAAFTRTTLTKMMEWCNSRNARIHGLYSDTEKYEKIMKKNKKLAIDGLEYTKMLYEEAKRLRSINRYHHEILEGLQLDCKDPYEACDDAARWLVNKTQE
ncbi:MAG: hypothetical protein IKF00_07665 [Solobacterium sp.]|nr:hypothetical protein [Solobacterium sp.]